MSERPGDDPEHGGSRDRDQTRREQSPEVPPPRDQGRRPPRPGAPGRQGGPGSDLFGDFQRWLVRSSARSAKREIGGQLRRTFGQDRAAAPPGDVWGVATTEPPPSQVGEAPECAWCPVCRAARRIRESRPDIGSQLAGAGDVVAAAVSEALTAFDAVLSRSGPGGGRTGAPGAGRTGAPAAGRSRAPRAGETGAPRAGETGAPAAGRTGAPAAGETGAPRAGRTGGTRASATDRAAVADDVPVDHSADGPEHGPDDRH